MKKILILIACLLSLGANAQDPPGTIRRKSVTPFPITAAFGGVVDSLLRASEIRALISGYSVSLSGSYNNPSWITGLAYSKLTGTVPTWNQNTTGSATLWNNQQYSGTTLTTAPTVIMAFDGSMYRPTSLAGINAFMGGPFLPLAGGTLTGTLTGTRAVFNSGTAAAYTISATNNMGFPTAYFENQLAGSFALYTVGSKNYFDGNVTINGLSGTGTRMVVSDNVGNLSTQAIPSGGGGGTVASVSVNSANGFAGTSSGGANPALTLTTTVSGILSGNGTAISAAATTGSGSVVLATSPTLTTPIIGVATGTSLSTSGALNSDSKMTIASWDAVGFNSNTLKMGGYTGSQWTTIERYTGGTLRETLNSTGLTLVGIIAASNFSGSSSGTNTGDQTWSTLSGKPSFATVATTGAYSDLSGLPDLTVYMPKSGGTFTGAIAGTTATFSGDVTANSDSTLKKNIRPLVSLSTALRAIGAYSYDWKSNDAHAIGLIAQEVQKYFPELVKTDEKGILSMNYQNFTSVLLQGWKELDDRITKLEQR